MGASFMASGRVPKMTEIFIICNSSPLIHIHRNDEMTQNHW